MDASGMRARNAEDTGTDDDFMSGGDSDLPPREYGEAAAGMKPLNQPGFASVSQAFIECVLNPSLFLL